MSTKYNPNSLAFPRVVAEPTSECDEGMDLRTYLAGQALAGYMATITARADTNPFSESQHAAALGALCVRCADAVIEALNAVPTEKPLKKPVETPTVETPTLQEFPEV